MDPRMCCRKITSGESAEYELESIVVPQRKKWSFLSRTDIQSVDMQSESWLQSSQDDLDESTFRVLHRADSKNMIRSQEKKCKLIGKYIMGDILGVGSFGKVKEMFDSETLCRRAVKILHKSKLQTVPGGEENAQREIQLLRILRHKNVVELVDVLYNDVKQKIYIVMELCVGVIQEMLDASPDKLFPQQQAHDYFTQLLDGLEYLHGQGVVHKDIKPGNLLLTLDSTLKIIDFNVSEVLDRFSPDDTCYIVQGTPAFQPPEIANGAEQFSGFKFDIWSSGVTLYNMTTGCYPFDGENIFQLMEAIGRGEPAPPPASLGPALQSLLLWILQPDPQRRPTIHEIRRHEWVQSTPPLAADEQIVPLQPHSRRDSMAATALSYVAERHRATQDYFTGLYREPSAGGSRCQSTADLSDQSSRMRCCHRDCSEAPSCVLA